jgi:hypothetical protein
MRKTYKQYSVKYYNNDYQLKKEYVYADNHNQAMVNIMDKYDIYKVNIASVALLKTITL